VLDDTEREALLQIAVSTLPVEQDDLAVALATVATPQQLSIATERLVSLSLVARTDHGLWVHRWTAEALRTQQRLDHHRARCLRGGRMRLARIQTQSRDISEGIEATHNFLDAHEFDNAASVALDVCDFLKRISTLDLASFARHVRAAMPSQHEAYKNFADYEAQALLALGDTRTAVERYADLVHDHQRLVAAEPDRADYQRDLSVSYERLGELQGALGQGDVERRSNWAWDGGSVPFIVVMRVAVVAGLARS